MGFLPTWLNPFDVLIALALLAGIALGFVRGLVRMALSLLVLYVATILAMNFYVFLGGWLRYLSGYRLSEVASETTAFVFVLIVLAVGLSFLLKRTYRDTEWPGIRQVDQLGGLVLGFFLTIMWIGLALIGIAFVLGTPGAGSDFLRQNLLLQFQSSRLIPIFYDFLPIAFATLKPWIPKGQLPEIFTFRLY
jgi:uncharacterized membrane protein required for colicin V production